MSFPHLPGKLRLGRTHRNTARDIKRRLHFMRTAHLGNSEVTREDDSEAVREHRALWSFGCMDKHCEVCYGARDGFTPF